MVLTMNILFWNLKKQALREEVYALAHEHDVDFLLLAEDVFAPGQRLMDLNRKRVDYFFIPGNCERIRTYSKLHPRFVRPSKESPYYSLMRITPPLHKSFIIMALHWKSKMYRQDLSQSMAFSELGITVRQAEKEQGHQRTIVIGDFNADPFDPGICSANGFHAVMSRDVAMRMQRKISPFGNFPFFYNPTWSMFGDENTGPPGSYYRASSEEFCQFWHLFDQCLVRPDLVPFLPEKSFFILSSAGDRSLVSANGTPEASDHLPLLFKFELPFKV